MIEIAFIEPYLKKLHGNNDNLKNKFLILYTISKNEFFNKDEYEEFCDFVDDNTTTIELRFGDDENILHDNIRNFWEVYNKIAKQPQIVKCVELENGEQTAIVKTFWLKIFQRRCKKIFKERNKIIKKRCNPSALRYRRIHGKWPKYCIILPTYS